MLIFIKYFYKIPANEKETVEKRKRDLQAEIKKELGILIDIPTQGSGNTNCGNTAKTYFKNCDIVAKITGKQVIFQKNL